MQLVALAGGIFPARAIEIAKVILRFLNGFVLGGYDGRSCLNTVERYDLEVNVWSYIAAMNTRRSFPGEIENNCRPPL
jgi:hypothetical protein